jgi:hypothetical protein
VITTRARARWAPVVLVILAAASCGRADFARDIEDPTPPTTSLSVAGSVGHPSFTDVADGTWVRVSPGAQVMVRATAADPDGVGRVELRVTEVLVCPTGAYATTHGAPPLVRAPESSRNGAAADTPAPSSLTTSYMIEVSPSPVGCARQWDVRAAAINAARTPVGASGPHVRFAIDPLSPVPRPR